LDNNATTQPLPEVCDAMLDALQHSFANASSGHALGRESRRKVVLAREKVALLVGSLGEQVIFTSGGTEANNQVILSAVQNGEERPHLITSTVEHSSILKTCEYLERKDLATISYLPVDCDGVIGVDSLGAAINEKTALVSMQWVSNETGVIQNIEALGAVCQERGVPFHLDAAQAVGKIKMDFSSLPLDFLTFTAHKIHGPQGVGAIVAKNTAALSSILFGGSQEGGLRPGTENLAGIIGFGVAAALRTVNLSEVVSHLKLCRDHFETGLKDAGLHMMVNGGRSMRVCNTSNIQFIGIEGLALMARLGRAGVVCSQSSACTNQRPEPSYVLSAMGLSEEEAYASVRFCFSQDNTLDEVGRAVSTVKKVCDELESGW
jgi:cysteine desulfurase